MICHFLIGVPASGKSTFAQLLAQTGNYQIISTDTIRKELYGDEIVQGNWLEIEAEVLKQIKNTITLNKGIIYDATNAQRAWRMDLLSKIEKQIGKIHWLAWYLNLDLKIAQKWNSQRDRTVPDNIIERMNDSLQQFPPHVAEGFINIVEIKQPQQYNLSFIEEKLNGLERSIINRENRTKIENITPHRYSKLLDFDRLMHLISLLIAYPELGNLEYAYPDILEQIFGNPVTFDDSLSEISAVMAKLKGNIYADKLAIEKDLQFLINYGLIKHNITEPKYELSLTEMNDNLDGIITHYASDKYTFERILNTIKTIADYPFLPNVEADFLNQLYPDEQNIKDSSKSNLSGHLTNLTCTLISLEKCPDKHLKARRDLLRKDIQFILKPYQILPKTMRNGYFLGTGILSERELVETFRLLQTQTKNIDDPLALNLYHKFEQKMKWANFDDHYSYPVRAIANHSMIDTESLDSTTLSNQTQRIQEIIEQGKLVQLNKFANRGSYEGEEKGAFCGWLLQIVFYNFAWYVGFEQKGGEKDKLFRFERLDRLYIQQEMDTTRSITEQKKALKKLTKLLSASYGIHLGNSVEQQKLFLSSNKEDKQKVQETVELWFSEKIFSFVAEGTKRFPSQQMKMTKPPRLLSNSNSSLFSLSKSKDKQKPYRFQVTLPQWSLDEFDFIRWILGFGGEVKVHKPKILQKKIITLSSNTINVYQKQNIDSEL
ncbi:AAA family ATPase [Cyanobacterium sp. DS4]|uniref:AAA family ATPase n=1 Tax=Cyanobacterium sp. DS4 TaxID=2878255 RepID=UPI002E7FB4FB|nr:AAA family ATPase [Cyanobacterium sp. Dongsha4]WVL00436.1 WYL domain-containing protein [Cyanobacterium sp. Dongsha4]